MKISRSKIEIELARKMMNTADLSRENGIAFQTLNTALRRGACKPKTAGAIAKALGVDVAKITEGGER